MYIATSAVQLTVLADGATGGKLWFTSTNVPPTAFVIVRAFSVTFAASAAVNTTQPAIRVERMSFTGAAAAAAAGTPVRCLTTGAAPQGRMSAAPGAVLTAGNIVKVFIPPIVTATPDLTQDPAADLIRLPTPMFLAAGEGLVLRQNNDGDAAEARTVVWTVCWDEEPNTTTAALGRWFGPRA